jgi:hypothetical protein
MTGGISAILGGELINPPIGQTAANATLEDKRSAFPVIHASCVVTQIELGTVATKVRFAHVVIGADHTTLERSHHAKSSI